MARLSAALIRLGRWLWARRGRSPAAAAPLRLRPIRLAGAAEGTHLVAAGPAGRVILLKERRAPRRWTVRRSGAGSGVLERADLPERVVPPDLGLPSAVIVDARGVKHYYGPEDDLAGWLRE